MHSETENLVESFSFGLLNFLNNLFGIEAAKANWGCCPMYLVFNEFGNALQGITKNYGDGVYEEYLLMLRTARKFSLISVRYEDPIEQDRKELLYRISLGKTSFGVELSFKKFSFNSNFFVSLLRSKLEGKCNRFVTAETSNISKENIRSLEELLHLWNKGCTSDMTHKEYTLVEYHIKNACINRILTNTPHSCSTKEEMMDWTVERLARFEGFTHQLKLEHENFLTNLKIIQDGWWPAGLAGDGHI